MKNSTIGLSNARPTVAVMIPAYNAEDTLPLAIESLRAQSYPNWHAVIVNDGSTDSTYSILENLEDERITVIHFDSNRGRPLARNAALDICKDFPLIAFLDADDFYHPKKLELQVAYLLQFPEVHMVSCGMGSFQEGQGLLRVRGVRKIPIQRYQYRKELNAPRAASLIRSDSLGRLRFNERLGMAQDSDFFMRYCHGKTYGLLNDILYYYSEFDSVSKNKILKSHGFNVLRFSLSLRDFPLASAIQLGKSIIKLGVFGLRMPFMSIVQILQDRGQTPTSDQILEYDKVRKQYMS